MAAPAPPRPPAIVLFDGECVFCDRSVQFIIARDPRHRFKFAALQSPAGRRLLETCALPADHRDSLVLVDDDEHAVASTAALRIARRLRFPWPLLWVFVIVPRPMRDYLYARFAARRYRWFGRYEHCMTPTPEMRSRFIEDH